MIAMMAALVAGLQASEDLAQAARATLDRGSFAFRIVPATDLRDVLPQDRAAAIGVPVSGERDADGTYRVTDGALELFGRDRTVVARAGDRWQRLEQYAEELIRDIRNEVGTRWWWQNGNLTRAKEQFRRLIALAHLYVRAVPPDGLLKRVATDLRDVRRARDGVYDGALTEAAARALLQGPFEEAVRDGSLILAEPAGRGRVWVGADGLVRKTELRAAAKVTVVDRDRHTRRTTPLVVVVTTEFSNVGSTTVRAPEGALRELAAVATK